QLLPLCVRKCDVKLAIMGYAAESKPGTFGMIPKRHLGEEFVTKIGSGAAVLEHDLRVSKPTFGHALGFMGRPPIDFAQQLHVLWNAGCLPPSGVGFRIDVDYQLWFECLRAVASTPHRTDDS